MKHHLIHTGLLVIGLSLAATTASAQTYLPIPRGGETLINCLADAERDCYNEVGPTAHFNVQQLIPGNPQKGVPPSQSWNCRWEGGSLYKSGVCRGDLPPPTRPTPPKAGPAKPPITAGPAKPPITAGPAKPPITPAKPAPKPAPKANPFGPGFGKVK
jgi:hypothetical protein